MKKNYLVILILICILAVNTLSARYKDIPVTRDLNPDRKYISYEEYLEKHPFRPTEYSEINRVSSNQRDEGVLIIVESDLYPEITDAIVTYQNDLANEGYNSFIVDFSGTIVFDMKIIMMLYYQEDNVRNVILIGDLPVAWFEMFEDFNNNGIWDPEENWVEFPIELYFSDIDGSWQDTDNNGIYDYHEGDKHPEIGIGRIQASNMSFLSSSEAELINSYFQRNHLYRNGFLQNPDIALAYIDDDWAYWGPEYQEAMQFVYPETELVDDINQTTAEDYRTNRLTADYEFIQVHVHSGPDAHYFYENNGNNCNTVTNYQISYLNPTSYFYNLFACSNSRFTENNNMGGMYLLGNDYCLGTIGSTKTGSMLWFEDFYEPLSLDETMGEALRQWWELSVDVGDDWMWQRAWFYGMAIQGDPSLKLTYEDNVVFVPDDYPTIQEAIDAVENGNIVLVNPGTYVENINYNGKNITVASLFYATQDTSYISQTVIDGNQDGSVVTFESGEDSTAVLCGFTIRNGLNTSMSFGGGGIFMLDSSPNLSDLIISANYAHNGGGIYCANSCPVMNDLMITDNEAPPASGGGGGIYLMNCDNMNIENLTVMNNTTGGHGAGMCISGCESMTTENVILENNESGYIGGNLYINLSDVVFENTTINHGDAFSYGGGIKCGNSQLDFENVQISYNCASFGAGIYADGCDISIKNTMIMNNGSESGAAITADTSNFQIINSIIADNGCYEHGIISCSAANDVYIINSLLINNTAQSPNGSLFSGIDFIFNSIIWDNTEPHLGSGTIVYYSDIQGGWEGEGNIDSDPLFLNHSYGDFHLQDTSPCIGAGIDEIEIGGTWYYAPLFDIEGNPRPDPAGSMPDMGAYENPLGEPQVSSENYEFQISNFKLMNYPNPFNPSTTIFFELNTENTELIIYNIRGQKIRQYLILKNQSSIIWDGTDENNQPVSSGIYFYKIKTEDFQEVKKMILLK